MQHHFGSHLVQITQSGKIVVKICDKKNTSSSSTKANTIKQSAMIEIDPVKNTICKVDGHKRQLDRTAIQKAMSKFYLRVYNFAAQAVKILKMTTPSVVLKSENVVCALLAQQNCAKVWMQKEDLGAKYDLDTGEIEVDGKVINVGK